MVIETFLVYAAIMAVASAVEFLINLWGKRTEVPLQLLEEHMSETDEMMQERTRGVIKESFGEDVVSAVKEMDSPQRVQAAQDFTLKLAREYGLELEVTFYGEAREQCGYYNFTENKIYLNVADLLVNDEESLRVHLHEFFDTIIHELRHAVQYRAIEEKGFWDVDDELRLVWADNFSNGNYVNSTVDPRAYAMQPVEMDARTFAFSSLEGVL